MNASQARLSLVAKHLTTSSSPTNIVRTATAKPPTFRERNDYKYFLPIQTRWTDNDQYGHINNSIYYHYIDTVVNEYLIKYCGLDPLDKSQTKPIGLVVHSSANFYAPASYPSVMEAGLVISKLGKSSVTYRVGIFEKKSNNGNNDEHNLASVVGGFTHVFVDPKARKPVVSLPTEILAGLQPLIV
ncbi:HotDog domain-containing protein [Halteromyces radiatus]|uniref:HotDog domain-containing protein n=1 Tax=Halteromyces radiatus TaxID=101107 RepID=UPI00221FBE95|nr:HotDog domain-containing protein [Halteromyces radiatus]KAI8092932.1 HotDog domain-containing protein [Halteromyces radiatus]